MQENAKMPPKRALLNRKILFKILIFIFPVLILSAVEFSLRIFNYGQKSGLFIDHPDKAYHDYKIVNPEYGAKYFHTVEYSKPKNDLFLKKKDPNCFRIMVMGSSSVAGFPYDSNLMFSRILQARLQNAYPDKKIEMINTAITAINSFTLLDITDDILAEKPDAVLIYAGHNEYYGAFGVGSNEGIGQNRTLILLHLKLMNLRLYQLIQNAIGHFTTSFASDLKSEKQGTLMTRIVKKANIEYQSPDYQLGLEQFRQNMSVILEKASKKEVPVFISTLVSNLSDLKPFGSATARNEENAEYQYNLAVAANNKGDFSLAKKLFTKARDLDCVRFRASSDINTSIEELARKYHAVLVPMLQAFEQHSPNSIVGNNLLLEHVHPNLSGYFLMADVFYNSLVQSKLIQGDFDQSATVSPAVFQKKYGYTSLDSLLGYHMIEKLKCHWPYREASKNVLDYRQIYKPVNLLDSLAFLMSVNKEMTPIYGHLLLAKKYLSNNDLSNAKREYKAIVQIAPYSPEFLNEAADFYKQAGDLPLALNSYARSLEFEPSSDTYFKTGEICMIRNDYERASQHFRKALETAGTGERVKILIKLLQASVYRGKMDEANQLQQEIRSLQPGFKPEIAPSRSSFGNFIPFEIKDLVEQSYQHVEKMEYDQALALLFKAVENCDSPDANRMIGMVYLQKEDLIHAEINLAKAYSWYKFEPDFVALLIQIELQCGKVNQAKAYLTQLKTLDSNHPGIRPLEQLISNSGAL